MTTAMVYTDSVARLPASESRIATFGEFELDLDKRQLLRAGNRFTLQPLQLALLVHLVENRERLISREELLREVWGGVHVCESAIMQAVSGLRRALGDDPKHQTFVQTIRGQGYRFARGVVSVRLAES
ncbi:MAG: winged helix-turn-helix domain-containing protein [Myxococcota bacterium]